MTEHFGFVLEHSAVVGTGRRVSLGFPAWVLVNDPANGHHALNLVKDIERLTRVAKTKLAILVETGALADLPADVIRRYEQKLRTTRDRGAVAAQDLFPSALPYSIRLAGPPHESDRHSHLESLPPAFRPTGPAAITRSAAQPVIAKAPASMPDELVAAADRQLPTFEPADMIAKVLEPRTGL